MMRRIVSYGPAIVVLAACVVVLVTAPMAARRASQASTEARITLTRQALAQDGILAQLDAAIASVAESVKPSVVHIDTSGRPRGTGSASGAGWVYNESGLIVTNAHVVRGARSISVEFSDGRVTNSVSIVGTDPYTDIAVLRVNVSGAVLPIPLAERAVPRQGERAFAFGSPFGFKFSMSEGIISGLGREPPGNGAFGGFTNYIQTDAAVNPGNSGGPLVNIRGELIGMNVAIATARNSNGSLEDDDSGDSAGISFAIPLGTIRPIVEQIVDHGDVRRGFLGINFAREGATVFDRGPGGELLTGIRVTAVIADGPAVRAGVEAGDVIVEIGGSPVFGEQALRSLVTSVRPGEELGVVVLRDGKLLDRTIKLGELPQSDQTERFRRAVFERMGLWIGTGRDGEPVATRPSESSPAEAAGFERGDVITRVGARSVRDVWELYRALEDAGLLEGVERFV